MTVVKGVKGFSQGFLETYLCQLGDEGNWETFIDVLALTLYDILLFPSLENFVSQTAMDVFIVVRNRLENPVTAILTNNYVALDLCYEKRVKKLSCYVPILYVWLMARIGEKRNGIKCPIELVLRMKIEATSAKDWS